MSAHSRIDHVESHPPGEIRRAKMLVAIIQGVRKFAAPQKISEERAVQVGLEHNAGDVGADVYANA